MSAWVDIFAVIGLQHLWQGAALALLAWGVCRLRRLSAELRSWLLLGVFVLAAISPLAVFLPCMQPAAVASMPMRDDPRVQAGVDADRIPVAAASVDLPSILKPVAVLAWLLGSAWQLRGLLAGWRESRRLRSDTHAAPDLERLLAHALPRRAAIKVSDAIAGPMMVGLLHPCILVPRTMLAEFSRPALLDVLHHEIAHVRRHDLWATLAQRACIAACWWSPWLRSIAARLDLAREMACDARAVRRAGGHMDHANAQYARSLLAGADTAQSLHARRLLASGMSGSRRAIGQRIDALLSADTATRPSAHAPTLLLLGLLMGASVTLTLAATPRIGGAAFATDADDRAAPPGGAEKMIAAAETGQVDDVRRLIRSGVRVDARVAGEGTALIAAARAGDLRMVNALLRLRAPVDQSSLRDGNPLINAAMRGHLPVVQRLVAAGADVNAVVTFDETPLINAARSGDLATVRFLVEHGADVNLAVRADFGLRSPLNQARGDDVRDYLIAKGATRSGS